MADLPNLTTAQVTALIPGASHIEIVGRGGQKLVFRGTIAATEYALKFAKLTSVGVEEIDDFATSDIAVRAKREVDTMRDCASPYVVKLGPIGLTFAAVEGQQVVYFSEEFIAGRDLRQTLTQNGPFPGDEVAKIGRQIGEAIRSLWELGKVHRDIKPANIMRRITNGDYVLLDAGLAFDVDGESISVGPVGTPAYFSPEQFEFTNRRTVLDFRSDMFSLGVTMYFLATGTHPFYSTGDTTESIFSKINNHSPPPPGSLVSGISRQLDDVILRLLGKSPHLRFRKCDLLIEALKGL